MPTNLENKFSVVGSHAGALIATEQDGKIVTYIIKDNELPIKIIQSNDTDIEKAATLDEEVK